MRDVVERISEFVAKVTAFKDSDLPMYVSLLNEAKAEIGRLQKRNKCSQCGAVFEGLCPCCSEEDLDE